MARTTRNQTLSTPPSSRSNSKPNASSVVTPDQSNKTDGPKGTAKIPKKRRTSKRSTNSNVESEKEDAKPAARQDKGTCETPAASCRVDEQKAPSAPEKKKSIPRTKKHKKEKESKFDALFRELETAKPVASSAQAPSSIQQAGYRAPSRKVVKAYTFGTYDGMVIYSVYGFMTTTYPAYTSNIKYQFEYDPGLKKQVRLLQVVNKRDTHDPFNYWRDQLPARPQDNGDIRFRYWPLYLRWFENIEDNTPENREIWGRDFTVIVNDLATKNADGTSVKWPIQVEYQKDMGRTNLVDYLTVPDCFVEIERRWVHSQVTTPDQRRELMIKKVLNNRKLLEVFFGDDDNFIQNVTDFYKRSRGLTEDALPPRVGAPESEDSDEDEDEEEEEDEDENEETDEDEDKDKKRDADEDKDHDDGGNSAGEQKDQEGKGEQHDKRGCDDHDERIKQSNAVDDFKSIDRNM